MLRVNDISLKMEKRERTKQGFPREPKEQVPRCLGHVALSPLVIFARNCTALPHADTAAVRSLLVVVVVDYSKRQFSCTAQYKPQVRSSMQSIWGFQCTLKRVPMISNDYVSGTTHQSPSRQPSMTSPRSPVSE